MVSKKKYRLSETTPGKRLPGKKELERKKVALENQLDIVKRQMLEWVSPATRELLKNNEA